MKEHAIPRVDWRDSRTLFLVWIGQQLAARIGDDALAQSWMAHVVPRAMFNTQPTVGQLLRVLGVPRP